MAKTKLSVQEKQFCYHVASHRNVREAAALVGYTSPIITGLKLMLNPTVKAYIQKLREAEDNAGEVAAGLRNIAFGSIADPVKLATAKDFSELDVDALDLHMVSELKFSKGGGVELKFFDRIKALERLMDISQLRENDNDLFSALESSVRRIEETGE